MGSVGIRRSKPKVLGCAKGSSPRIQAARPMLLVQPWQNCQDFWGKGNRFQSRSVDFSWLYQVTYLEPQGQPFINGWMFGDFQPFSIQRFGSSSNDKTTVYKMVGLEVPGNGLYDLYKLLFMSPSSCSSNYNGNSKLWREIQLKENDEGAFVSCEPVTGAKNVQKA